MADLSSFTLLFKSKRFRVGETSGESKKDKAVATSQYEPEENIADEEV